jgi:hypothetical protein
MLAFGKLSRGAIARAAAGYSRLVAVSPKRMTDNTVSDFKSDVRVYNMDHQNLLKQVRNPSSWDLYLAARPSCNLSLLRLNLSLHSPRMYLKNLDLLIRGYVLCTCATAFQKKPSIAQKDQG